jgi:cell cycle protein
LQINEFLNLVCEQIKYKPIRNTIAEELKDHIEDKKEELIEMGQNEEEAEKNAVEQMGDAEIIGKELNKVHRPRLDWKLLIILVVLLIFGFVISYIITENEHTEMMQYMKEGVSEYITTNYMIKYVCFVGLGFAVGVIIYFCDYERIKNKPLILYIIATVVIILAFLFGISVNGINFLRIGNYSIRSNTIAIPLYILAFIGFLENINEENKLTKLFKEKNIKINANVLKLVVLSLISLLMLSLIPSSSSVIVLAITYLILATKKVVSESENKRKHLLMLWGIPIIVGTVVVLFEVLANPYVLDKFISVYNPEEYKETEGWRALNRKEIIESAQKFGEAGNMSDAIYLFDGFGNNEIISILAHFGWIPTVTLIIAVLAFSIKLVINSFKIKEKYGSLIILGIGCMFILQSVFNILMNFNLIFDASFNLPFVTYDCGELVVNMMCLALIFAVYRKKDVNI